MSDKMTYAGTGVRYDVMDEFKRKAQRAGIQSDLNIKDLNGGEFRVFKPSRGESAFLIEAKNSYFAHVEEGLGTKNLVADEMFKLTGKSFYDRIAVDTVAMIVNDMATVGAQPLSVAMHLAVEDSSWFENEERVDDLISGWKYACDISGCVWGGGETPTLKDIIVPDASLLSGSAIGLVKPKERLIVPEKIKAGDAIVMIESNGIHANGLTLARRIAEKLTLGYSSNVGNNRTYGDTLLDPTFIYVKFVQACLILGIDIHYAVNITGHGLRKLMRAEQKFAYVVETLPEPEPIFKFIQEYGPVDDREAYGNLNMGNGFALYVSEDDVNRVLAVANNLVIGKGHFKVWRAGHIEESSSRRVVLEPKNLEYSEETLEVR